MIDFQTYIKDLQSSPIDEITEHSKRTALETVLKQLAINCTTANTKIQILHEPKRREGYGSPDFKLYAGNTIIGYVENKKITENLDRVLKSEQIKKYRELSQNLLITNYIEFIWIHRETIHRETLCYLSDIENTKFKVDKERAERVEKLLVNFFSQAPQKITSPQELALALATRCKNLKDFLKEELTRQNEQNEKERLHDLFQAFKENIFAELTIAEFSDAFAQMLAYGLFLAGLNADTKAISLQNAKYFIPSSFQLIKELIGFLDDLEKPEYAETKWIIDEIISIINHISWVDLSQNMRFDKKVKDSENIETDPYIYFYETFLATYDHNLRKSKGVYYTPPQVVNFIVRAIDKVLIQDFDLPSGLADRNKVTVLDFATGTGTFLLEVFKVILEKLPAESIEKRKMLIKDHILQNLFGFEYLIAPYTIAHLKLSQFLKEYGYEFQDKERLQVYLTNTLEPVDRQIRVPFMPQLTKETRSAQEVKDKPILVIVGNPPYAGHSKNNGEWIKNEIKKYNFVDGKPLGERNPKTLQDDYVKFIRFAQDKMDKAEQGIVGIITNHSFLDNPTFRGMRQSLMNTFDQMYFIDLHGNAKKKETTPEGKKDQNIFDIEQGVCISILIKKKGLKKGIYHTDFWGLRSRKFDLCLNNTLNTLEFNELSPNSPFYLFVPQNQTARAVYEKFWSIKDIFEINNVGIVTSNDNLTIAYNKKELEKRFSKIKNYELQQIKQEFNLSNTYFESRKDFFFKIKEKSLKTKEINYRPFDKRSIWWDTELIERSRENIMKHFEYDNLGLVSVRQVAEGIFNHVFISQIPINYRITLSNKGGAYIFPLYRYNGNGNGNGGNGNGNGTDYLFKEGDKRDNFTEGFRKFIRHKYSKQFTPEQILGYIYAILFSHTYRTKYAELLKMDFPRIPFTEDEQMFEKLSNLGFELIQKHLLKKIPSDKEYQQLGIYKGEGDNVVQKPDFRTEHTASGIRYKLYINKTQYFETVPEQVYNFQIGGYQVLDKYIKDRKDRTLTHDEVDNIENVVKVLAFTIKQMELIDRQTKEWI
ncbi:MAG: N-6 DNA methylase [Microscillaceae bacterium]|nr:N-6 DNA methylase [Microscillaceae bacterium]MDW8460945.1 type ISP restriction/modification enzyme [Cytophagales bacterium]